MLLAAAWPSPDTANVLRAIRLVGHVVAVSAACNATVTKGTFPEWMKLRLQDLWEVIFAAGFYMFTLLACRYQIRWNRMVASPT